MKNEKGIFSNKLKEYIANNYIEEGQYSKRPMVMYRKSFGVNELNNDKFLIDEPFNIKLFKLIDASGKSDVEVYKKAGIDRRHFSKIKSSSDYVPQKKTIVAFIVALELSTKEAEQLLDSAGYSLSKSYLFDVIVKFFITEGIYDINVINESLLEYDQPLIGY